MANLRDDLLDAYSEGNFLQIVYTKSLGDSGIRDVVTDELVRIHNDKLIDAVACFRFLENKPDMGYDFFLSRRIFEKALPKLNAPVKQVMECVLHLFNEAGQDMSAGLIFEPFVAFCEADSLRPKESLQMIEEGTEKLADLLSPTIVAGSRLDIKHYLNEAIRLASHEKIELRKRAIFSLGKINYSKDINLCDPAISCLESSNSKEDDDHLLGNLIKSAFAIYIYDNSKADRVAGLLNDALSKGDSYSLHAASELFGFNFDEMPETILELLLVHLMRVKPENKGTLDNIDYGLIKLLNRKNPFKGIEFLETLLTNNHDKISMDIFPNVIVEIIKNDKLLNKLMTRWFLRGDRVLCDGIWKVVRKNRNHRDMLLEIDLLELMPNNHLHIVFVARKAIGFLFFEPLTAASVIISLMNVTTEDETLSHLGSHLFNPLLLNFPRKIKEYLIQNSDNLSGKAKTEIEKVLKTFDEYIDDLKSTGVIPELHPAQTQRDAHHRHFSNLMSESFKEVQKESVILSLVSKSVLLYGRKSINYIYTPDGKSNRMEIPLQSHGTEMDIPRFEHIDSFGLDYMIRHCKAEQMKK
jgi:hypothetical protein